MHRSLSGVCFDSLLLRCTDHVYGLEKFWAYLKYRRDTRPVEIMPDLKVCFEDQL